MTLYIKSNGLLNRSHIKLKRAWFIKRKLAWQYYLTLTKKYRPNTIPLALFIVGSGRSGTDIVCDTLNRSFDVTLINEDNPLAFNNWRLKNLSEIEKILTRSGSPIVAFKPIVETMRIKELLKEFPNSKGLFVFRNYNDAINSQIRFFGERNIRAVDSWIHTNFEKFPLVPKETRYFAQDIWKNNATQCTASGLYWFIYNSSFLFLRLHNEQNVKLINYEKLVTNPEQQIKSICHYLGTRYSVRMCSDIYSSSISKNSEPNLPLELKQRCEEVWRSLTRLYNNSYNILNT